MTMNELTHFQAQNLIQASMSDRIGPRERQSLQAHLEDCAACRAYERKMRALESGLRQSMHARWDTLRPSRSIAEQITKIGKASIQFKNRLSFIVPAATAVSLVLLFIFAMSLRPHPGNSQPVDQTAGSTVPVGQSGLESSTPEDPSNEAAESSRCLSQPQNHPDNYCSPDGAWVAIIDPQAGSLAIEEAQGVRSAVYPAGSTVSQVRWSPDSRRLAVILSNLPADRNVPRSLPPEIRILDFDGGTAQEAGAFYPPAGSADPASGPGQVILGDWSPDSRRILFWTGILSGSIMADGLHLWVLDFESMQAAQLSDATLVNPAYQSWAPDGAALVFTNGGYRSAQVNKWLSLYEVESGQTRSLLARSEFVPGAVAWSPAASVIAFAAVRSSETGDQWADYMGWDNPAIRARRIYLFDPKTGEYRRINDAEAYQDGPRWSPDGETLYYVQIDDNQAVVMKADPSTGEAHALPGCQTPLPDGAGYYGQVDWNPLFDTCHTAGS